MSPKPFRKKAKKSRTTTITAGIESGTTENSKPIIIHHIEKTNYATILGIVISLLAAALSGYAIFISNNQFQLINQSYLDVEWHGGASPPKDSAAISEKIPIRLDQDLGGMNLGIDMLNLGNIPLTYKINTFDIFFEGKKVQSLNNPSSQEVSANGIIYPKQKALFDLPTIFFHQVTRLPQLKDKRMHIDLIIEYNDLNNSRKKIFK